jgi:hypothetical protein
MKRQGDTSPAPVTAASGRPLFGVQLDRAGWLLVLSVVAIIFPLVWAAISRGLRKIRRAGRERKRLAELRASEQLPPPVNTLASAAILGSTNEEEDERAALMRPKLRARDVIGQSSDRSAPGKPESEQPVEDPMDRALRYVRMLRDAPDDMREDLLERLEAHLIAVKSKTPVVIRPHRRFEQNPAQ